ncbi:hypothetical protein [Streptomyces arboris]|uniref:Squalene cyclase C-terminal domain-containing protein n=1 Tax=Streptomyces arboris TaxID=2600619 RepID=A0A5N5EC04_9ACTN|nr:hypothetical protein [Streptomyces arboris]KAB2588015.1 hypothetical protein F5983_34840 [Streptomyces arboris]
MTVSASADTPLAATRHVQCAVERAWCYLNRSVDGGAPSARLSLDVSFSRSFSGARARAVLRERLGADPGFDLADEAFTAMVALMLLSPAATAEEKELALRLGRQLEAARWQHRYRFFLGSNGFPADTDCTGLAVGALYEHGLLSPADLEAHVADLLHAAAPVDSAPRQYGDDDALRARVFMVYWEDGLEPHALRRGRKHDAVACANALYTAQLSDLHTESESAAAVISTSTRYLAEHLESGRYLNGTRYYPSPDAFLYALSRLCARFPSSAQVLAAPLRRALQKREEANPSPRTGGEPGPLALAFRTLAADNLGLTGGQDQRRMLIAQAQQSDGSWPASPYYRMGRFPVYFGSSYLTTVFALAALRTPQTLQAATPGSFSGWTAAPTG